MVRRAVKRGAAQSEYANSMAWSIAAGALQRTDPCPALDLLGDEPVGERGQPLPARAVREREVDCRRALEPVVVRERLRDCGGTTRRALLRSC